MPVGTPSTTRTPHRICVSKQKINSLFLLSFLLDVKTAAHNTLNRPLSKEAYLMILFLKGMIVEFKESWLRRSANA